ncbi:T9SS type A sorting domain-containing protein [Chryseobacterium sp. 1B4]
MKVLENNENKIIPYIKNTPKEVAENEIVQSATPSVLQLKVDQDELSSVNIFDENKFLIKSISQKQYREAGGINVQDLENKNYTFEVVTPYYNLQFSKATGGTSSSESNADIFTQKQQIIAKAGNGIKNISIYSISGSLILQQEVNQPLFESRSLESGVYLVQITLSNGKVINKKVKL